MCLALIFSRIFGAFWCVENKDKISDDNNNFHDYKFKWDLDTVIQKSISNIYTGSNRHYKMNYNQFFKNYHNNAQVILKRPLIKITELLFTDYNRKSNNLKKNKQNKTTKKSLAVMIL